MFSCTNLCRAPTDEFVINTNTEFEHSHLATETFEARFNRYVKAFTPNADVLRKCTEVFHEQLVNGLKLHKKNPTIDMNQCPFKMLDAWCPSAPTGEESGIYYALDFGGSNFRVVRCEMKDGNVNMTAKKASLADATGDVAELPKGLLDPKATASQLFDYFALIAKEFMTENGDLNADGTFKLGFTFSYPCALNSLDSANLLVWTKGFETGRQTSDPVENRDIAALMNEAFGRHGVNLKVNCVANDTVGTLLASAYTLDKSLPRAQIGVILGTGMNACYEDQKAIESLYHGTIINIEAGNFNSKCLPRTNVDYEIDFNDVGGRGVNIFEKMISGGYLGEICRRALVKIFQYKATPSMWVVDSFDSGLASACCNDDSEDLSVVAASVKQAWGTKMTVEQLAWVKTICRVVFERSAALSAMCIAAIALKTGYVHPYYEGLTVGVDGSLYKCNEFFREDVVKYLNVILGESAKRVHLVNADDGSGLGAAILAAIADTN